MSGVKIGVHTHVCQWRKRFNCTEEGEYKVTFSTQDMQTENYICGECLPTFTKHLINIHVQEAHITRQEVN